ncbi:MAG: 3-hydroxyacyl-[acyl-carrier-protein] dehydratase FabZ [Candidatus Eremiobacteraeota bacterium]|nr:3-hydroxyacyl-[acyl-carrier-protein] dehydratase FabZ [Candidatus Eremiobacteraeota bacterium]MCW5866294.1 3-hydroxyacyl-[acyl-carrier-protein] dehydratase FabZ [Candidatus Eremiobacteraeota bacterium]
MDTREILNYLPHRDPMLLIDRLTDVHDDRATGIKQLSQNEWFFQGHFGDEPEMPVSLLLESMGQTGAAAILSRPENQGKLLFLAGMDLVEVQRAPTPGQSLRYECQLLRFRGQSGKTQVSCYDADERIAFAEYTFVLSESPGNSENKEERA